MTTTPLSLETVRALYAAGDAAHDFDHVLRVTRLAHGLAQAEGADPQIVELAALLHDLPVPAPRQDPRQDPRRAHHLAAALYAGELLAQAGYNPQQIAQIVHCIEAHRFRDQTIQPQTLEARCLYDADKLDSMGAIGVGRAFAYAGAHGSRLWTEPQAAVPPADRPPQGPDYTPLHEFVYKLQRLLDSLHTTTARRMGAARHQTMIDFFAALDGEMAAVPGWAADGP